MSRRALVAAVALVAGTLSASGAGSTSPRTAWTISVQPEVAALQVSWPLLSARHVDYVVSSQPTGKQCVVVDVASCQIAVTDATPWTFQVTAYVAGSKPQSSNWSAPVARRYLVIVAGQSNALGATSYVTDPTTHIDYLSSPYANSADQRDLLASSSLGAGKKVSSVPVSLDSAQLFAGHKIFGPEISLARTLARDRGVTLTIVKTAATSTSLALNWNPALRDGSFAAMEKFVRDVMSYDAKHHQFDVVGAFAWYQGESDANVGAKNYRSELEGFLAALRARVPMAPTTPVVIVKESIARLIQFRQTHGLCVKDGCATMIRGDGAVRAADDYVAAHERAVTTVDSLGAARTVESAYVHLSNVGELSVGTLIAQEIEKSLTK